MAADTMFLPPNVHEVLKHKLKFTHENLEQLSHDADLAARVLGYLHIIRSPRIARTEKIIAIEKLVAVRRGLNRLPGSATSFLQQSLAQHYSFSSAG